MVALLPRRPHAQVGLPPVRLTPDPPVPLQMTNVICRTQTLVRGPQNLGCDAVSQRWFATPNHLGAIYVRRGKDVGGPDWVIQPKPEAVELSG